MDTKEVFANPKAKPIKVNYDEFVKQSIEEKIENKIEEEIDKKIDFESRKANKFIITLVASICGVLVIGIGTVVALSFLNSKKEVAKIEEQNNMQTVSKDIYVENSNKNENIQDDFLNEINNIPKDNREGMRLTFLGDIMMGGPKFSKLTELYSMSFKEIAYMTSKADYTITNFTTVLNETNPEKVYSKYITSKSALSALKALGVDVINLANPHILDYGVNTLDYTKNILEKDNFITYGVKDSICYLEKNNMKIGLVTSNDVVIGTRSKYVDAGVAMYSQENIEKQIKEARENANMVIVSLQYGLPNSHVVTDKMKEMARHAIDAGADMVVGYHAMGVLPVEIYKGKPILYSVGDLISDTKSEYEKQTATIDVEISKDFKVKKIVMNPVYISETETVKPEEYKKIQFLEDLERGCKQYKTPVSIQNDKVVIELN